MTTFPAVLINGPRAVGKTTTAKQHAATTVRLDNPRAAAAFTADPDSALGIQPEPVLLDEWQEVPQVLGAVKRAVDDDPRPGRFLLTGSVRAELEHRSWPGTGRLVRMAMYGLAEAELQHRAAGSGFLERLEAADPGAIRLPSQIPDLVGYIELAVRGAFPEVVLPQLSSRDRDIWLDSYLGQLLSRDAALGRRRDSGRMAQYFEALATTTAGLPQEKTLAGAARVDLKTARAYDRLFEDLFITERVPAWAPRRLARLVHAPKRYIVDAGLAARAMRVSPQAILGDGDLLGRTIDGFAMAQLRVEMATMPERYRHHHLRTHAGRQEIDLIIELDGHRVLALEFKATSAPSRRDARHLEWLRDQIGARLIAGVVLHTGPAAFVLGERLLAVPLCAIWG